MSYPFLISLPRPSPTSDVYTLDADDAHGLLIKGLAEAKDAKRGGEDVKEEE